METSKGTLRITHTAADGTLLQGSAKGDGAWEAIKAAQDKYRLRGWKYFRSMRMIGVSHSRTRAPSLGLIDQTAEVLRAAGFTVEVEIDGTPRDMREAEAERAEHMDERADYLDERAARHRGDAESRANAAQQIADGMDGSPILVGHHSEARQRRDIKRMDGHMRASIAATGKADYAAHNADSARRHMDRREAPRVIVRRIRTLEADLRRAQRGLAGYSRTFRDHHGRPYYVEDHPAAEGRHREQLELTSADLAVKIAYWKEILQEKIDAGEYVPIDLSLIKKGDEIGYWGGWSEVIRVNKVTVTVKATMHGREYGRHQVKVDEIRGHRRDGQLISHKPDLSPVDLDDTGAQDAEVSS